MAIQCGLLSDRLASKFAYAMIIKNLIQNLIENI